MLKVNTYVLLVVPLRWYGQALFQEIQIPISTLLVIWCDSTNALAMTINQVLYSKTKHIELNCHFICDKVIQRQLSMEYVQYVSSYDQPIDILTKLLSLGPFQFFRTKFSIIEVSMSLRRVYRLYMRWFLIIMRMKMRTSDSYYDQFGYFLECKLKAHKNGINAMCVKHCKYTILACNQI